MAAEVPPARAALERGLAVAAAIRGAATDVTETNGVNRLVVRGTGRVGDLPLRDAMSVGADGHVVDMLIGSPGAYQLRVRVEGPTRPYLTPEGDPLTVVSSDDADELARAVDAADAATVLRLLAELPASVALEVRNDPERSGTHWVRSVDALASMLMSPEWIGAVTALANGPRVIATEEQAEPFVLAAFAVAGRTTDGVAPATPSPTDTEYRAWRGTTRTALPTPTLFAPRPDDPDGVLTAAFAAVTRLLVWWWLADDASATAGALTLSLRGARLVHIVLRPQAPGSVAADVALYTWATVVTDPARAEAVQQAASLAIGEAKDVATAAEPVLRTAQSLYELSRRGAVAEALAARRAARASAVAAARDTSGAARDAATKSVERVMLHVGAAGGIVLANSASLVGRGATLVLLAAVAALVVASFATTWWVDLAAAQRTLDAELDDLTQFRDTLGEDDLAAIRDVSAVGAAKVALRSARVAALVVYPVVVIGVVAGMAVVATGNNLGRPVSPTTTPTNVRPSSVVEPPWVL